MADYLTIAGSQINLNTGACVLTRCTPYTRGGIPELLISKIVGKTAPLPDSWSGQSVKWSNGSTYSGSTTYFSGTIVGYTDRYDHDFGWTRDYRALGLKNLADYVPVTDSNTLSDSIQYNMPANAIDSIVSRMGRTCGQAVLDVLSMPQNAAALASYGIGNYSSSGSGAVATANMSVGNTLATYGTITSLSVVEGGSGYTTAPTVVIAGPCTTQAVYTATVSGGAVTGFTQVSAGSGYTTPPAVIISTLPSLTVNDLANLTVIPPFTMTFCGERVLQSIESVIQTCHPNHWLYVDVAGNIRVLDQRVTTNYTVTLGNPSTTPLSDGTLSSRWLMPQLHRDISDTYSQLIVRGDTDVSGVYLSVNPTPQTGTIVYNSPLTGGTNVNTGGLYPYFTFGPYTSNSAAIAAWSPSSFAIQSLQGGQDQGTCTCSSTTQIVITSSNTALTLTSDQLDQSTTGLHAVLTVYQPFTTGIAQMFSTSVIANTAMSAGGTSTLTVAPPLPATTYTSYFLTFSSQAGNVVYRRYICTNPAVGAALQQYFPYPFAYRNADGTAAALTSAPVGMVLWSSSGSAPYNESDFSITVDPESGTISFPRPTALVYGGGIVTPPDDIMAFVPVATGDLTLTVPGVGSYAGTLYTVEGIQRTKTITLRDWTQYGTNANISTYATEQFDSICDVVVEGSLDYLGLPLTYLTPGCSISITGNTWTTGWETLQSSPWPAGLPIVSCEVVFQYGAAGTSYLTTLQLSNRKQRYTGSVFTRPPASGQALGTTNPEDLDTFKTFSTGLAAGVSPLQQAGILGDLQSGMTGAIAEAGMVPTPNRIPVLDTQHDQYAQDKAQILSRPIDPGGVLGAAGMGEFGGAAAGAWGAFGQRMPVPPAFQMTDLERDLAEQENQQPAQEIPIEFAPPGPQPNPPPPPPIINLPMVGAKPPAPGDGGIVDGLR